MKKFLAIISSIAMLISLSSCGDNNVVDSDVNDDVTVNETVNITEEDETELISEVVTNEDGETEIVTEIVKNDSDEEENTTKKGATTSKEDKTTKKALSSNPADWNMSEVVSFYKKACLKSSKVISTQTMVMRKDSLKCENMPQGVLSFADGAIRGVMKLNKKDNEGITGGHQKLTASDCKTAKAYKSGDYTVVEMTMKDQTDGMYGDTFSGTVGHAISVVGGVEMVVEQFEGWDVVYEDGSIQIHYTDAKLKVKINKNGVIEKGTWSYVTTPEVNNLEIMGFAVNNAGCVIDYKVVVGGGF